MTVSVVGAGPGRMARLLVLVSVAGFWLLPFSPLIALGAVSTTSGSSGWPRRLAVTGAFLCTTYTLLIALLVAWLGFQVWVKGVF